MMDKCGRPVRYPALKLSDGVRPQKNKDRNSRPPASAWPLTSSMANAEGRGEGPAARCMRSGAQCAQQKSTLVR